MMELQYFRGLKSLYNKKTHGNGIYFATDTQEIIHNGLVFSGVIPAELEAIKNKADNALELIGAENVKTQIDNALNDFAVKITDDGTVNTLKELVDYIAENDVAQLILDVDTANKTIADHESRLKMVETKQSDLSSQITKNANAIAELHNEIDEKIEIAFSWKNVN